MSPTTGYQVLISTTELNGGVVEKKKIPFHQHCVGSSHTECPEMCEFISPNAGGKLQRPGRELGRAGLKGMSL